VIHAAAVAACQSRSRDRDGLPAAFLLARHRLPLSAALTRGRLGQVIKPKSGKRFLVDLSARFQLLLLLE
jgi:hypothetical protein